MSSPHPLLCALLLNYLLLSSISGGNLEDKTLAMIKPDGLSGNFTDKIKNIILDSGFHILRELLFKFDEANARVFYSEHSQRSFFLGLIEYIKSGPVLVMVLEKPNAVSKWRALIGPTDARKAKITHPDSIRALCGTDVQRNCVHGSDSLQAASREIRFFFGETFFGDPRSHDEL